VYDAISAADEDVECLDRNHLRAGLAVHIDEHGEEKLDAVGLGSFPEITLDVWHAHTPSYPRGRSAGSGRSPQVNVV